MNDKGTNNIDKDDLSFIKRQLFEMAGYFNEHQINFFYCLSPVTTAEVLDYREIEKFRHKHSLPSGREDLMTLEEQKKFYNELFRIGLANEMVEIRNRIKWHRKNGILLMDDLKSNLINIKNGHRNVPNAPRKSDQKILLVGKCNIFSLYQDDYHTIAYYLQEMLLDKYEDKYEVVISANPGIDELSALYCEKLKKGDIVLCSTRSGVFEDLKDCQDLDVISLKEAYISIENLSDQLFNCANHHNHIVNKKIAELIFEKLQHEGAVDSRNSVTERRKSKQNYYIPIEVDKCYRELKSKTENFFVTKGRKVGSIVMNCNPFTKGHRYLVEEALKHVDYLYVFIVQEDKSRFAFCDRFRIAQKGLQDLSNRVCVLGSGNYIISQETFAQYFEKEDLIEYVEDMRYDLHIFGEVVSKYFGISVRFVGEEPFDIVTAKYNSLMKKILPQYGVSVIEVPRTLTEDGDVVSASSVRRILDDSRADISKMIPKQLIDDVLDAYGRL